MQAFFLKIAAVILSALTSITSMFAPLTFQIAQPNFEKAKSFDAVVYEEGAQLIPEKDENGDWTFTTDRELKVLQLSDIHIGGGLLSMKKDAMALNCVAAMITAEKPDLVVLTGDMVYPVPFQAGTFNNEVSTLMLIELMEKLGVYYTVCLGNHDSEAYSIYDRAYISGLYANPELKYSIYQPGPDDVDGYGNQVIKVKNSQGLISYAIFVIDSHDYTDGDILGIQWKYDNVHENQIEWYAQQVDLIDAYNKQTSGDENYPIFPSILFQHIPTEEHKLAWNEYVENNYQDTENVQYVCGELNDSGIYHGIHPDMLFETILEKGSTKALFTGHDHQNNFSVIYKGVRLGYGMSVDYLAYPGIYREGKQRGCNVIMLNTADGSYTATLENYYQDKYPSKYEKEAVKDLAE